MSYSKTQARNKTAIIRRAIAKGVGVEKAYRDEGISGTTWYKWSAMYPENGYQAEIVKNGSNADRMAESRRVWELKHGSAQYPTNADGESNGIVKLQAENAKLKRILADLLLESYLQKL